MTKCEDCFYKSESVNFCAVNPLAFEQEGYGCNDFSEGGDTSEPRHRFDRLEYFLRTSQSEEDIAWLLEIEPRFQLWYVGTYREMLDSIPRPCPDAPVNPDDRVFTFLDEREISVMLLVVRQDGSAAYLGRELEEKSGLRVYDWWSVSEFQNRVLLLPVLDTSVSPTLEELFFGNSYAQMLCDRLNAFRKKEDEPWQQYKALYEEEWEEWKTDGEEKNFLESQELFRLERAARERDYYQDIVLPFSVPSNDDGEFLVFDFGTVYFDGEQWTWE